MNSYLKKIDLNEQLLGVFLLTSIMDHNILNSLLIFCPQDILLKIRFGLINSNSQVAKFMILSLNPTKAGLIKIRHSFVKNKIEFIMTNMDPTHLSDELTYDYPNSFELDNINKIGCFMSRIDSIVRLVGKKKEKTLYCGNFRYSLLYDNVGGLVRFTMKIYSNFGKTRYKVRKDKIDIDLELDESIGKMDIVLDFKNHVNGDIIFLVSIKVCVGHNNQVIPMNSKKYFILIYNKTCVGDPPFQWVMLNQYFLTKSFVSKAFWVATSDNKKMLCIYGEDPNYGTGHGGEIHVYDIINNCQLARIIVKLEPNEYCELSYVSFALIGKSLVCVKKSSTQYQNQNFNFVKFIWINSDDWSIKETIICPVQPNIIDVKLVRLHDYLSAIIFLIKRANLRDLTSLIYYF